MREALRYEDFTLLLTGAREVASSDHLLTFHVQVPSAAGLAAITELVPSGCDLEKVRRLASADPAQPPAPYEMLEAGLEIGRALFPGRVLTTVRQAIARVRSRGQGLRLRIIGDSLHWISWEYAVLPPEQGDAAPANFLALMPDISIARDQACPLPERWVETPPPFRILCAAAHPKLAAQIDVADERRLLEAALRDVRGVDLQWLEGGMRPVPSATLRRAEMFHFAGHGALESVADASRSARDIALAANGPEPPHPPSTGVLIFDDGRGGEDRVSAGELGILLRELGVRVAVLNACKSARRDPVNAWTSVATALLRAGVHSVVAMQHAILDASAIKFAAAFYRALAEGASLDEAARSGRFEVFAARDLFGWGTPVLYLPEKSDGAIFRAAANPARGSPRNHAGRIDYGIELQRHRRFVGRAALLAWLDQLLLAGSDDRWVLMTGGPGVGKSALLAAWLARRQTAGAAVPHHFIRRGQYGWDNPATVVSSLVFQIEERYSEQRETDTDVPQDPAMRLAASLMRVSTNELVPRGERLVIVIDGLDQFDPPPGTSRNDPLAAFLPHALPAGVSVLCASRPREPHMAMLKSRDGALVEIDLNAPDQAADNEATVRAFWEAAAPMLALDARQVDQAVVDAGGNMQRAVTQWKQQEGLVVAQRRSESASSGPMLPGTAMTSQRAHKHRAPWRLAMTAAMATLLAAVAVSVRVLSLPNVDTGAVAIDLAAERFVDVRFTAQALDHHRPLVVMRAANGAGADRTESIGLPVLSELERSQDHNTLVGAFALNGDLASAERRASQLANSAAGLTDRAALELLNAARAPFLPPAGGIAPQGASMSASQLAAVYRALSLTADALRLTPGLSQAKWNQAIALRQLGLSLAAAARFDEIAALHEPGWSEEAAEAAARLRRNHQRAVEDWQRVQGEIDRMVGGGPILSDATMARAPSSARDALYLALATAATSDRIAKLAPLAKALDAQSSTTALSALVAQLQTSNLQIRAPFAEEFRAIIEHDRSPDALRELRRRALVHGLRDIALASLLPEAERATDDDDLAVFDKLLVDNRDDWWQVITLARKAYRLEFWHRDYPAVDTIRRRAEPICKTLPSTSCNRILLLAGGANSQMGRAELAIEQLTAALRAARTAGLPGEEADALEQLGQAMAIRASDDFDSATVGDAYLEDVALRKGRCRPRLQRLDFATNAALQHHRFGQAAQLRAEADALERDECRAETPRLNGETARLRLLLSGRDNLERLRANVASLRSQTSPNRTLYVDFLSAAATLVEDPPVGRAGLRRVIDTANADPAATYASDVRPPAFNILVESAARSGDATAVFDLLTERLATPRFDRCALGIASWNRLVIAVLDRAGRPALEVRDIPEGAVMIPPRDAVSPSMRARLAGCSRIDVVTSGQYLGAAYLLDDGVAWAYRTGTPRPPRKFVPEHELVVSNVIPPEDLHLPALQSLSGTARAHILSGAAATPNNVLAAMKSATLIHIAAHGFTDALEPKAASLVLSPDLYGDYLLTASKVSSIQLAGSPVVVLAGCDAGRVQISVEPWSLATAFIRAGARVVIAPTEPIPDASANDVFRALVDRIHAGTDPVEALAAERRARGPQTAWLSSVVAFE